MTLQTHALARQPGPIALVNVERVKDDSLFRIQRSDLKTVSAAHPSDRNVVIEINRPRIARGNLPRLKAGFRKNQRLRIGIDAELFEEAGKISQSTVAIIQLDFAALEFLIQLSGPIANGRLIVTDGRMVRAQVVLIKIGRRESPHGRRKSDRDTREIRTNNAFHRHDPMITRHSAAPIVIEDLL